MTHERNAWLDLARALVNWSRTDTEGAADEVRLRISALPQVASLRADLSDARNGWESAAAEVRDQDEEIAQLRAELEQARAEVDQLRGVVARARAFLQETVAACDAHAPVSARNVAEALVKEVGGG